MHFPRRTARTRAVLILGGAVALGAGGTAAFAIPSSNGAVQACYHSSKGNLRVVDSPTDCRSFEKPLALSSGGVGTLVVRSSEDVIVPQSGPINRQARAFCEAGEQAISGGVDITGIRGGARTGEYFTFVVRDQPLPEPPAGKAPEGWLAEATNVSAKFGQGEDSVLRAHVVCAS